MKSLSAHAATLNVASPVVTTSPISAKEIKVKLGAIK